MAQRHRVSRSSVGRAPVVAASGDDLATLQSSSSSPRQVERERALSHHALWAKAHNKLSYATVICYQFPF